MCGAPLTTPFKKNRGGHTTAASEVLRCLASYLCYHFAWPFLFCCQVQYIGVGFPGGLEAVIHADHYFHSLLGNNDSLTLLRIEMKNAFNECSCIAFLDHVSEDFLIGYTGFYKCTIIQFRRQVSLREIDWHKSFPEIPPAIKRVNPDSSGLELLGSVRSYVSVSHFLRCVPSSSLGCFPSLLIFMINCMITFS